MNLEQAHQFVESRILQMPLTVPVIIENTGDYLISDLPKKVFESDDNFIRFGVELNASQRLELGTNPASKEMGFINVDIYIKRDSGTREIYKYLDIIDVDLKQVSDGGIEFRERNKLGNFKIGKWIMYSYQYSFYFCN